MILGSGVAGGTSMNVLNGFTSGLGGLGVKVEEVPKLAVWGFGLGIVLVLLKILTK